MDIGEPKIDFFGPKATRLREPNAPTKGKTIKYHTLQDIRDIKPASTVILLLQIK
jgi:hypothetical protein